MGVTTGSQGLNISIGLVGRIVNANVLAALGEDFNLQFLEQFLGGTGGGQIDTFYAAQLTVAASSTGTIDLAGTLVDAFGNTATFGHVKGIYVQALAANTNDFQIGPGASNPFNGPWSGTTPLTAISPGEAALWTKGAGSQVGWPVTASTGDIIKTANSSSGTGVTANVAIWGTSN